MLFFKQIKECVILLTDIHKRTFILEDKIRGLTLENQNLKSKIDSMSELIEDNHEMLTDIIEVMKKNV